jgi:hypothetical protein
VEGLSTNSPRAGYGRRAGGGHAALQYHSKGTSTPAFPLSPSLTFGNEIIVMVLFGPTRIEESPPHPTVSKSNARAWSTQEVTPSMVAFAAMSVGGPNSVD